MKHILSIDLINYNKRVWYRYILTKKKQCNINKQLRKIPYHEFLNFGIFSSFELSAIENLDGMAQPLQNKAVSYVSILIFLMAALAQRKKHLPKLDIVDIILVAR
jgi:hypothetical protein